VPQCRAMSPELGSLVGRPVRGDDRSSLSPTLRRSTPSSTWAPGLLDQPCSLIHGKERAKVTKGRLWTGPSSLVPCPRPDPRSGVVKARPNG
jgi:hypothetical protein